MKRNHNKAKVVELWFRAFALSFIIIVLIWLLF